MTRIFQQRYTPTCLPLRASILAALLCLASTQDAQASDLSFLLNAPGFRVTSISADGKVIAGWLTIADANYSSGERTNLAYYSSTGQLNIVDLDSSTPSNLYRRANVPTGISANGAVIVGNIFQCTDIIRCRTTAFRWNPEGGFRYLTAPSGIPLENSVYLSDTEALGVSGDGNVVVGFAHSRSPLLPAPQVALVWRNDAQTRHIFFAEHKASAATAASFDGSVVAGYSCNDYNCQAFRWTETTGGVLLGTIGGNGSSRATDISMDGQVITGQSRVLGTLEQQAFRWTPETGMVGLGTLPGHQRSDGLAISGDGKVIVGYSSPATSSIAESRAIRWSQETGLQAFDQYLATNRVQLPTGIILTHAIDTSQDGSVTVGHAYDIEMKKTLAWVARIGNGPPGIITDTSGFMAGLGATSQLMANTASNLPESLVSGSRNRTIFDRITASGNSCAWATAAVNFHDDNAGRQSTFDAGICKNFGSWRAAASIGNLSIRQRISTNVNGRATANNITFEAATRFGDGWEFDILAAVGRHDLRFDRSYMNGNAQETSAGKANGNYGALRTRILARNLWGTETTKLTPHFSISRTSVELESTTETGGAFPTKYTGADWRSTNASTGVSVAMNAGQRTSITTTLDFTHRISEPDATIGADPGVPLATQLDADNVDRNWLNVAVQLDHYLSDRSALQLGISASSRDTSNIGVGVTYSIVF